MRLWVLPVCAVVCLLAAVASAAPPITPWTETLTSGILINGGFDNPSAGVGGTNWLSPPPAGNGWDYIWGVSGSIRFVGINTGFNLNPHAGNNSLVLQCGVHTLYQNLAGLVPLTYYRLQWYGINRPAYSPNYIKIEVGDLGSNTNQTIYTRPSYDYSAWTLLEAYFQATSSVMQLRLIASGGCDTCAFFDTMSLYQGPSGAIPAPVFTLSTPTVSAATETTISVSYSTDIAQATTYCAVVQSGSAATLLATGSSVKAAVLGGVTATFLAVGQSTTGTISLSGAGVVGKTTYDVACSSESSTPTMQTSSTVRSVTTPDLTPPSFLPGASPSPSVSRSPATGLPAVTVSASINEVGKMFCVVAPHQTPPVAYAPSVVHAYATAAAFPAGPVTGSEFVAGAVSAPGPSPQVSITSGLALARAYDISCVANDETVAKVFRVLAANLQGTTTTTTVFTGGCQAGNASVLVPTLQVAQSGVVGANLVLSFRSSRHLTTSRFAFLHNTVPLDCAIAAEVPTGSQPPAAESEWVYSQDSLSCDDTWTYTYGLAGALAGCGFSKVTGADAVAGYTEYRAEVQAVTVENGTTSGPVFAVGANQTRTTSVVVGVRVPELANASASAAVFGSALVVAAEATQSVDSVSGVVTLDVVTSVQAPYQLAAATSSASASPVSPLLSVSGASTATQCTGAATCRQMFRMTATPGPGVCSLDHVVTLNFTVVCSTTFSAAGSCDSPLQSWAVVSFPVRTDNMCARVVEVAAGTTTLKIYGSAADRSAVGGPESANAVTGSKVYLRAAFSPEAGLSVVSLHVLGVRIHSFCGGGCLADAYPYSSPGVVDAAAAGYSFVVTSESGAVADFEFVLNDNSISFDGNLPTGQVDVQVTVDAIVTYADAANQKRPGGGAGPRPLSFSSSAAAESVIVGVSSPGFAGTGGTSSSSPSSSSASTVLGVSQGTLVVAVVAVVAAVATVAGVVLVRRRRRRGHRAHRPVAAASSGGKSLVPSASSSSSHEFEGDVCATSAGVPAAHVQFDDLRVIQDAYVTHT